jgi:hypothetical protein
MKIALTLVGFSLLALPASAQSPQYVRPYVTQQGNYVAPHMRTAPDTTRSNNYSTQGNVNPYTGQAGSVPVYPSPSTMSPYAPYRR